MALKRLRSGRKKSDTRFTGEGGGVVEMLRVQVMNRRVCLCFFYMCVVLKGSVHEAPGWELSVWPLQVCVPVVVGTCEARCGGGYVTVVMIGCGWWRHEWMCVCGCRQELTWLLMTCRHTHTYTYAHAPSTQSTMYLISDFTSHAVRAIRRMTSGRLTTCQAGRAKFDKSGSDNPQPTSSVCRAGASVRWNGGQVQVKAVT